MRRFMAALILSALCWLGTASEANAWHGYGYGRPYGPGFGYAYRPQLGVYFGAPQPPPPVYPYPIPPRVAAPSLLPSIWLRL